MTDCAPAGPERLVRAASATAEALLAGRLAFVGRTLALALVVDGAWELFGRDVHGVFLVAAGAATALVTVRFARLTADHGAVERRLRYHAAHEPLTGLPNRRELLARLAGELRGPYGCLILFCDLDGLKAVNDTLGHAAGDQLLVEVARRLLGCVREHDTVSRFGGDEFVILYREAAPVDVMTLSARIDAALVHPMELDAGSVTLGVSIGAAYAGGGAVDTSVEELVRQADEAMYAAKRLRRTPPRIEPAHRTVGTYTHERSDDILA